MHLECSVCHRWHCVLLAGFAVVVTFSGGFTLPECLGIPFWGWEVLLVGLHEVQPLSCRAGSFGRLWLSCSSIGTSQIRGSILGN